MEPGSRNFERAGVARIRRSPWLVGLSFSGIVPLIAYFAASDSDMPGALTLTLGLMSVVTPFIALMLGIKKLNPVVERGSIRVDATGVYWNGKLQWPRDAVRHGLLVPTSPHGPLVRLTNPSRLLSVDIAVANEHDGRELLDALDLGATHRTADFLAHPRVNGAPAAAGLMVAAILGTFVALNVLMRGHTGPLGILMAVAFAMLPYVPVMAAVAPTKITVGVDGVLLRRLGVSRFVSFRDVATVETYDEGVRLILTDGAVVPMRVGPLQAPMIAVSAVSAEQSNVRDALVGRIRDAMGAHARGTEGTVSSLAIERGGRSVSEWIAHLRDLARRQEGGMRQAPVLRSHLWSMLADPGASTRDRAGAAVALSHGAGEEPATQQRLRVMAQSVASPRLRVAIEAAAEGEDARLERALEQLEQDDVQVGSAPHGEVTLLAEVLAHEDGKSGRS
ncbi:MAG: hypothetical protein WCJ30_13160 [Deltaproteobacteria bacterium]